MWRGIILALALSGCATFNNPITYNELGAVQSAYGIALSAAVAYRSLPLCKTGTMATPINVCAQRSIIVKLQRADRVASVSIAAASDFVVKNPTLDATTLMVAAERALAGLQAIETTYGIR